MDYGNILGIFIYIIYAVSEGLFYFVLEPQGNLNSQFKLSCHVDRTDTAIQKRQCRTGIPTGIQDAYSTLLMYEYTTLQLHMSYVRPHVQRSESPTHMILLYIHSNK